MKAEHRKELKTNYLRARVESFVQEVKEGRKRPSLGLIIIVLVAVGVGVFFWLYYSSVRNSTSATWASLGNTMELAGTLPNPRVLQEEYQKLAEQSSGTSAARVAKYQAARLALSHGLQGLSTPDRANAINQLEDARKLFGEVAEQSRKGDSILKQQALLGEARAEEALVGVPTGPNANTYRGDLQKAVALYQQYLKLTDPDTPVAQATAKHVAELEQNGSRIVDFYREIHRVAEAEAPRLGSAR